jgi:hypothetical protein
MLWGFNQSSSVFVSYNAATSSQWYTYFKQSRVVRQAQKRSSETLSEVTGSIRGKIVNVKETVLPTRQSNENGITPDTINGNVDTETDSVPEPLRRSGLKSRRMQSGLNMSMIRDADDFINETEVENNMKWKEIASVIDDCARFWFPFAYFIAVAIVFARVK